VSDVGRLSFVTAERGFPLWLPVLETYVQTVSGSAACGRMRHKVRKTKRGKGTKIVAVTPIARLADVNLDSSDPELPSVLRSFSSGRTADVVLNAARGHLFEIGLSLLASRAASGDYISVLPLIEAREKSSCVFPFLPQ
jgi:hypothetical protein